MSTIRPDTAGMSQIVAGTDSPPGHARGVTAPVAAGPATAHGRTGAGRGSTAARADAVP